MSKPTAIPFNELFARRWAVPVLAQMHDPGGIKLVTLTKRLDAPRGSVVSSLELLIKLGLVSPNPGHGHPMRPEYILSDRGKIIAEPSVHLVSAINKVAGLDEALKRWSLPTLHAIDAGCDRFCQIAQHLAAPTDRALSMSIHQLTDASLINRTIVDERPPRPRYTTARASRNLVAPLTELHARVSEA